MINNKYNTNRILHEEGSIEGKTVDQIKRMEASIRIKKLKDRNGIKKLLNSKLILYPNEVTLLVNLLRFNTRPLSNIQLLEVGTLQKRYRKMMKKIKNQQL